MKKNIYRIGRRPPPRDIRDEEMTVEFLRCQDPMLGATALIAQYERELAQYFSKKYACALSSGTAAIHASLAALQVGVGDEVIVPVTAPIMSAIPILALNARPRFVDVEPWSFDINLKNLCTALSSRVKAILSVPMWGYPSQNIQAICDIGKAHSIPVVIDAAHAIGSLNKGVLEGTQGTVGCVSTNACKPLSTGEGGFVITDDQALYERIRSFSHFGCFGDVSRQFGLNYKCHPMSAGLGISQLKKLPERLKKMKQKAELWSNHLSFCSPLFADRYNEMSSPNYYGYVTALPKPVHGKGRKMAELLKKCGILTDILAYEYQPLFEYEQFRQYYEGTNPKVEFLNAYALMSSILVMPNDELLTQEEIEYASQSVQTLCEQLS